jgi:HD-GYP domain-containing protein (c-di-GMP phosphodiesterase class II)
MANVLPVNAFRKTRMPPVKRKISLVYFVLITLLLVGLVPLVVTGWLLSERSARELRAVEGRYQTQLVQDKARQIEMLGQRYGDLVISFAKAFELSGDFSLLSSAAAQKKLGQTLQENPHLLSLYVKPVSGEPLSVYRTESINASEIEKLSSSVLARLGEKELVMGQPQKLQTGGEVVLTIAAPVVMDKEITAAVVAIVSLREISRIMAEASAASEKELWQSGLPIVFVVDEQGRAVFHPDAQVVTNQKPQTNLKIVQEWQEASRQIQSALVPFTAEFENQKHEMIGAYSTANFNDELIFGVIAMQDESTALASVGDMRRQTWITSLALALLALVAGSLFARQLTSPILELVAAAKRIADGDLSTRIETKSIKEVETLGIAFNLMSDRLEEHIADLAKAAQENRELFVGTVKALAAAIDGKDKYTRGHSERVARFSVAIGKRMGMPEAELETLRISALLHDVGKIAIDDNILKKPAALTNEEFEIMKTHPQRGFKIMSQIPAMKEFLPGMYMHHEMVNGEGYPQGLRDDQIPLQAKIVSVADTFDAMTTDRPYQKGMNLDDALNRIRSFVGTRYDGKVVEALVHACAEGSVRPVGAAVIKPLKPAPNGDVLPLKVA